VVDGPIISLEKAFKEKGIPTVEIVNEPKRPWIEFLSPSQIVAYVPPVGTLLVGDNHIVRGGIGVIGGCPAVGKSGALVNLAEAGATKLDWLGLPVHCHFKTIIIQTENGKYRLKLEFSGLNINLLDQYLRISPPPERGLPFDNFEFRDELQAKLEMWDPGVVAIDPWNAVAKDNTQKEYLETFELVRDVIPARDTSPFILIAAHTNKPMSKDRANGRALLNLLSGSLVLGSVPRVVWILQHASDDVTETRVVVTCCKNNDGQLGPRSAWNRGSGGLWTRVDGFDWDEWENPTGAAKSNGVAGGRPKGSAEEQIVIALRTAECVAGLPGLKAAQLETVTGLAHRTIYDAIKRMPGRVTACALIKGFQLTVAERNKVANKDDESD
jgi:hypothetical protein